MADHSAKGDPKCACKGYGCTLCLAALPSGKTCADCAHIRRCVAMFGGDPKNTACDWIPSRFLARVEAGAGR
jgi:hypothetical protein